jgi:ATP-dependent helicase/nuclease subunit B
MTAATAGRGPRVFTIAPGAPFADTLALSLREGLLVPGFPAAGDPLALASATIYVPTRRLARALRATFASMSPHGSAILPSVRPLGEVDENEGVFEGVGADDLALDPPIAATDRLLHLATLVRAWKRRLPAHVAARFGEEVVVPASAADALWLARDLAALMDEMTTEGADFSRLPGLAPDGLAGWWQITLEFLGIVTEHWPQFLASRGQSDPAAHGDRLLRLEAERLRRSPPTGPVIAAGSTGSRPATAELLKIIAHLPNGAVVLPGLDRMLDERSWQALTADAPRPALPGHPQFGLAKLLRTMGGLRADVEALGTIPAALALRERLLSDAMRPAESTDEWASLRSALSDADLDAALSGVTLVEAASERDEAAAIAVALRRAVIDPGKRAALVTGDRELARRVSAELSRFGIQADDSGGAPLTASAPAALLRLLTEAVFRPGDPVPVLALLKSPLLRLGLDAAATRRAAETIELVALRGGTGRPDIAALRDLFETRLVALAAGREPFWLARLDEERLAAARDLAGRLAEAVAPLAALRNRPSVEFADILRASVVAFEALGRDQDGSLAGLYAGDAGEKLAELLRGLVGAAAPFPLAPSEWPDVLMALAAGTMVKPAPGAERRVAIWGALEARLQRVDTLVVGGLNEGAWPRKPESDRFLSRLMKSGLGLEPPERRIGQSAHDFTMAMGAPEVVLTRSARDGEAPSVASRLLQRLLAFAGPAATAAMRARGAELTGLAATLDAAPKEDFAPRPNPKPPVAARPAHFSVTEIETLRRDPYAVYARRMLRLSPLDPLLRDPGAAERGTLFHEILHRFAASGVDSRDDAAHAALLAMAGDCFAEAMLPADVQAIWWPRFAQLAAGILDWERTRAAHVAARHAEARAEKTPVGRSGVTLSGYADRVDLLPAGMADILDYKTGASPSKGQAHTLLSPQLALEAALLRRGAFRDFGKQEPAELAFVRLKPNGVVLQESILEHARNTRSAPELAEDAWARLERLLLHYRNPDAGYLSRALPFREGDTDGDYDHLARVLEWSAGGDGDGGEATP